MTGPADPSIAPARASDAQPAITDDYMRQMLGRVRTYTAALLRVTDKAREAEAKRIIWEHGRRNFALRAAGKLPIVCPTADDSDWAGIGIFDATPEEVERIMADDPGVKAGLFTVEIHPVRGFPGSSLPLPLGRARSQRAARLTILRRAARASACSDWRHGSDGLAPQMRRCAI